MQATLRTATPGDAACLSELALRSKAHWGYDPDFLAACKDELSVSANAITEPHLRWKVAIDGGRVLGFFGHARKHDDSAELEALFVEPDAIGSGIGRLLLDDAVAYAESSGFKRMTIQGDPNAEGFYLAMGARQTGSRESGSIPGRMLPVFEIDLRT